MNPETIGYLAAIFTTAAYIPQTIKVLREKNTQSLSLGMYGLISIGISLWLLYGIMIESPSLMVANGITLVMAGVIIAMKLKHG